MISISTLKKMLSRQDGREGLCTPKHEEADFLLQDRDLEVGRLWLHDGKWHFEYTDAFQRKKDIYPITNFPRLDKHYESEALWPFFAIRIPGLKQPAIQRILRDENIDARNEAQLLKRFGETTIANPFTLTAIPQGQNTE